MQNHVALTRERIRQGNRALQLHNMSMQAIRGWDFRYHAFSDFTEPQLEISEHSLAQGLMAGVAFLIVLLGLVGVAGVVAQVFF
jgi:hypothetical protein